MATRTFCDHCGNTCHNPKKFIFGPQMVRDSSKEELRQALEMARITGVTDPNGLKQAMQGIGQQVKPSHPTKVIDLCDTCVPIWLERVDKLCRASDADEKNV